MNPVELHEPKRTAEQAARAYLTELDEGRVPDLDTCARGLEVGAEREFREIVEAVAFARGAFPNPLQPLRVFAGRYELHNEIGSGGFGTVWSAFDRNVETDVAIKITDLLSGDAPPNDLLHSRERTALARIHHPGAVQILDAGVEDGRFFLVMERVDGKPLDRVIEDLPRRGNGAPPSGRDLAAAIDRPCPAGETDLVGDPGYFRCAAQIVVEMLRTLEAVHAEGIVHRDLKPSNVMLRGGGRPILLDFGVASLRSDHQSVVTRRLVGTLNYLAPEQVEKHQTGTDPRTDIYQVGLVLYELLTLRRAFESRELSVLEHIQRGTFARPRRIAPRLPSELQDVCLRAMEVDPSRRYQTAAVFCADLELWLEGRQPVASRRGWIGAVLRDARYFARRHRQTVVVAATCVVAVALGASLWPEPAPLVVLTEQAVAPAGEIRATVSASRRAEVYGLLVFEPAESGPAAPGARRTEPAHRLYRPLRPAGSSAPSGWAVSVAPGQPHVAFRCPVEVATPHGGFTARWLQVYSTDLGAKTASFGLAWQRLEALLAEDPILPGVPRRTAHQLLTSLDLPALTEESRPGAPVDADRLLEGGEWRVGGVGASALRLDLARTPERSVQRLRPGGGFGAASASGDPASAAGTLRALLIGIQRYPTEAADCPALHGAHADVAALRRVLIERFGFAAENVHELYDQQATLAGIVRVFDEELLRKAGPDDEVLFYFAGHGSRVPDASGAEAGGQDSSLIAYDSRTDDRRGSRDLTDDVLYSLLHALTRGNRAHVTAVTDACHSGGVVRGGRHGAARSVPRGGVAVAASDVDDWNFWPSAVRFIDDDARPAEELRRYVHFSACANDQIAHEYRFEDGWHGIMSWSLCNALRDARPGDTYRAVGRRAAARMQALIGMANQSLWVESDELDRMLFGRAMAARPAGFLASSTGLPTRISIAAGTLHGVYPRSVLRLRNPDGDPLGSARVQNAEFGRAWAEWIGEPPTLPDGTALWAEVAAWPRELPRLDVYTESAVLASRLGGRAEAKAGASAWVDVHGDANRGDYVLELDADRRIHFRTREGVEIWRSDVALAAPQSRSGERGTAADPIDTPPFDELDVVFKKEVQFRGLWSLASPDLSGELSELHLEFVEPTADELADPDGDGSAAERYVTAEISPHRSDDGGESASTEYRVAVPDFDRQQAENARALTILKITNETYETVHLHVLSLSESRDIEVLYPIEGVRDRTVSGDGGSRRVPVWVGSASAGEFSLARPMRDRYLVIAAQRPLDFHMFESDDHRVTDERSASSDLPGILQAVCDTSLTRGGGAAPGSREGWGIAWLDLLVDRRR